LSGNRDRASVSAKAVSRATSLSAGTNDTAKILLASVRFVAGRQPSASVTTAGVQKIASVMRLPRQRDDNGSVKRPKRQTKTEILVLRSPQTTARGHAARIILQIFATALGAMKRGVPPIERRLGIVAMIAARRSGACGIVNING
jgi:hypothetical protein